MADEQWLMYRVLSPGYMLTKLTRQVLSGDDELKVCSFR